MDLIKTPMSRVSCRNDENPENQADQFGAFLPKMVGFRDLVGTDFAPVSNKTAVKTHLFSNL